MPYCDDAQKKARKIIGLVALIMLQIFLNASSSVLLSWFEI